jgi:hypothetical protein
MAKRKISQKTQQTAEKYLVSLGSSREQLSDKQWEVFANYVKSRRMLVLIVTLSLGAGIFSGRFSLRAFQRGNEEIALLIPEEVQKVVFVSKAGEEISTLVPGIIKLDAKNAALAYWRSAAGLTVAAFFFLQLLLYILLDRRNMKKTVEAFIPREQKPEITSEDNSLKPL